MKIILFFICAVVMLASTGCVFWGDRDHDHWRSDAHDDHPHGVDHGEYPGDHREIR